MQIYTAECGKEEKDSKVGQVTSEILSLNGDLLEVHENLKDLRDKLLPLIRHVESKSIEASFEIEYDNPAPMASQIFDIRVLTRDCNKIILGMIENLQI